MPTPRPARPAALLLACAPLLLAAAAPKPAPAPAPVARTAGSGARTFVLLHGNFDRQATWERVVPLLAPHARVVTLDLPGYGESPALEAEPTGDALAEAVARVLDAQKVRRAVVVGNSMGGAVAAFFAARFPERVEALVLEDANFVEGPPEPRMRPLLGAIFGAAGRLAQAPQDAAARPALRAAVAQALAPSLHDSPALDDRLIDHFVAGFEQPRFSQILRTGGALDWTGLPERTLFVRERTPYPLLAIWGLDDPLVPPEQAEQLAERLPDARLVLIEATGHAPHLERPEAFAKALLDVFGPGGRWPAHDLYLPHPSEPPDPKWSPSAHPRIGAAIARESLARARAACDAGEAAACLQLARRHAKGDLVPRDVAQAARLAERACEAGETDACLLLRDLAEEAPVEGWNLARREALDLRLRRRLEPACALAGAPPAAGPAKADEAVACRRLGDLRATTTDLAGTAAAWQRACDGGQGAACAWLGRVARQGIGRDADPAQAIAFFERACAAGDAPGCAEAALQYYTGKVPGSDWNAIAKHCPVLARKGCDGGAALGCFVLALHERDLDSTRSRQRALLELACEGGEVQGCAELARARLDVGDRAGARQAWGLACAAGVADACAERGKLDAPKWSAASVARYDRECPGDALACWAAGNAALESDPPDWKKAADRFRRACEGGLGCSRWGDLLRDGRGTRRDLARAVLAWQKGCARDQDTGCLELGLAHLTGQGLPRDPAKANHWFDQTVQAEAKYERAKLLLTGGRGMPVDMKRGLELLRSACTMHHPACLD